MREVSGIEVLINNAGANLGGSFVDQKPDQIELLISLNVTAVARLASAIAARLAKAGTGAIVTSARWWISRRRSAGRFTARPRHSCVFPQGLILELPPKGVYVQAAHPSATKTEIWERSSTEAPKDVGVMEMGELVDAALIGYDRREAVTIPPLQDEAQWNTFNAARTALIPGFLHGKAASRYQTVS